MSGPDANGWMQIETAPKDGSRFWGACDDNAITMFWHEGFEAFISSFCRMEMAPGYTINGKPYEDHHPVVHMPTHWMPPKPPVSATPTTIIREQSA